MLMQPLALQLRHAKVVQAVQAVKVRLVVQVAMVAQALAVQLLVVQPLVAQVAN